MDTQWIKQNWKFISLIITVIFMTGFYYHKVNTMSSNIQDNQKEIKLLTKQHYLLLGLIRGKYPKINLSAYVKISTDKQLSKNTIVNTLKELKNKTPKQGKDYLIMKGYSAPQASAIYSLDNK